MTFRTIFPSTVVFVTMCIVGSMMSLPASAQEDISARVREHRERVHRNIEAAKERMRQHRASFGGSGSSSSGRSFGRGNTFGSGLNSDDYHAPGATSNNGNPYLRTYTPPAPPPGVPASYLQPPADQMHHYDPRNSLPPNVKRAAPTAKKRKPAPTHAAAPPAIAPKKAPVAPLPPPGISTAAAATVSHANISSIAPTSSSTAGSASAVPSKFDYSNSVNLDALKSTNAELTVHGTKFDIKGNIDWNRVRDAALRGAAIAGLVGIVAWLATLGLLMMTGAQSSGPRPGMESRGSGAANMTAVFIAVATLAGLTWWNGIASDNRSSSKEGAKLVPVHSNEFNCRVLMPSPYHKIYVKMIDPQTLGSKPIYYTAVECDKKDAACVMGYAKLPPLPPDTMFQKYYFDANKALDGATKGSVERIGGTIKSQYPITLKNGRHPGREADGTLPKDKGGGLFRQRIYISGGNYYQVAVYGNPDWVNSNDAYKFLDSFDLIEQSN